MEYYSKVISMNLLKNHISNDPIIDFFEISNIRNTTYDKDKNSYFRKYIFNEIVTYKRNFLDNLRAKILEKHPNNIIYENIGVDNTLHLIKNKYPVIFKPLLISHKYNINVSVDILINKRIFLEIFNDIKNVNFQSINNSEYLIINIIPEILHFKSDKKTLQKNDIITFNECSLYVFNSALKEITHRSDIGFVFGKGYKFKNNLLKKQENIALVKFDDSIRWKIIHAIDWIKRLKENNYIMDYNNVPCIELYPNMNNKDSEYQDSKKIIAEKIREITLIWRISYSERCELIKNNIKTWDNIYLIKNLYDLKDSNTKNIQEKIIHMNMQNEILISPRRELSNNFKEILQTTDNEYILDIESLINIEEKTNYFNDIKRQEMADVCIIGSIHLQENIFRSFQDFTINDLSIQEEKKVVQNWIKSLRTCRNNYVKIYHWGTAEKTYLNNMKNKFSDINFPNIILIDLLEFVKNEPIIIKDAFNFSLKNIGKAMYKHGFIKTTWQDTDNGLDAVIKFKEICEKNIGKDIPLKRYTEIAEIIDYNKIDCLVLTEILMYFRKRYS